MSLSRSVRGTVVVLAVSLTLAAVVRVLLRPPAATEGPRVVDDIDLTGQMRGVVFEAVQATGALATIGPETTSQEILRRRERVNAMVEGCRRLVQMLSESETSWIPVSEAQILLEHVADFGDYALQQTPTLQVAASEAAGAESTETNPDITGMTPETTRTLAVRGSQLLKESQELQQTVRQAALGAVFTRGTWLGFEAKDYLLGLVLISCVTGIAFVWRFRKLLDVPAFETVCNDLQLQAERHPQQAVDRCYNLSKTLLQLADRFLVRAHSTK